MSSEKKFVTHYKIYSNILSNENDTYLKKFSKVLLPKWRIMKLQSSILHRDTKLIIIYRAECLCENSRDKLTSQKKPCRPEGNVIICFQSTKNKKKIAINQKYCIYKNCLSKMEKLRFSQINKSLGSLLPLERLYKKEILDLELSVW